MPIVGVSPPAAVPMRPWSSPVLSSATIGLASYPTESSAAPSAILRCTTSKLDMKRAISFRTPRATLLLSVITRVAASVLRRIALPIAWRSAW